MADTDTDTDSDSGSGSDAEGAPGGRPPLVAVYSLTGTTRALADLLAQATGGDLAPIEEARPRRPGPAGLFRSTLDGLFARKSRVEPLAADPAGRPLVLVGGPVWFGSASGPVLGFLAQNRDRLGPVAGFCTTHSGDANKTFERMEAALGRPLVDRLAVKADSVGSGEVQAEVREFVLRRSG